MGGGGPDIPQRNLGQELGTIFRRGWPMEQNAYRQWWQGEPLLSGAHDFALTSLQNVGQLIAPLQNLSGSQQGIYQSLLPILQSQGALTPEQGRDVDQATRAAFAARGNAVGNQALGAELLNRDQYRRQRFGEALGQSLGLSGSISGLESGIQGLQTGALNQALGTEQAQVGTFASLINPLLSYGSNLGESNQNAAAAGSIAGSNKQSGLIGGGISVLGSIAAAY